MSPNHSGNRRFRHFFRTRFFGAFSDNVFRNQLAAMITFGMTFFAFDFFLAEGPASLAAAGGDASLSTSILLFSTVSKWRLAADLLLLAIWIGLCLVLLHTFLQARSRLEGRSRVLARSHILHALFMLLASILLVLRFSRVVTVPRIFLFSICVSALVGFYLYALVPEFILRVVCWILANVMYRLRVVGREHIPAEGPAVLVCNHVSYVDWLVIASACGRPVRFVMHHKFLDMPLAGRIFRDGRVIPIAGVYENREMLESAFELIAKELERGEMVCIFPEGRLTRDGTMRKFRPGVERIVRTTPVPVIPMCLGGLWGSFFSNIHGKPMSKPFRRLRSRISLCIGKPVPPGQASSKLLHELVDELGNGRERG